MSEGHQSYSTAEIASSENLSSTGVQDHSPALTITSPAVAAPKSDDRKRPESEQNNIPYLEQLLAGHN